MSALSFEKNGQISSSKKTKHIRANLFLIKYYYNAGEIDVQYCPKDVMWADVLTAITRTEVQVHVFIFTKLSKRLQ
jgi:hypothetical protein